MQPRVVTPAPYQLEQEIYMYSYRITVSEKKKSVGIMDNCLCGCCLGGSCGGDKVDDGSTGNGKTGKARQYDPHFKGPIRSKARRPKDLLCLLLFIIFIICLLAVGLYAWVKGEPKRIIYPTDSQGRLCGVHEAVADKPFLQFFDLIKCAQVTTLSELLGGNFDASALFTCPTPQVCVSECPTANEFGVRDNPVCVDSVDTTPFVNLTNVDFTNFVTTSGNVANLLELIRTDQCAPYYITSTTIARRCVPTFVDLATQAQDVFFNSSTDLQMLANMTNDYSISDVFLNISVQSIVDGQLSEGILNAARQFVVNLYQDLLVVWPGLAVGVVVALAVAFLYIILMRWIAGPIVFVGIGLSLVLITGITIFCYYQFYCFQDTAALFNQFDATLNDTVLDFINSSQVESVAGLLCTQTSVLREFINTQLPWFEYQEYTWLAIGIAGTLLLLILIILLIVLAKKILISIQILKEASRAVGGVPTSVFYPIMTFVLLVIVVVYWAVVAVFLVTASEPTYAVIMNGSVTGELTGVNITEYNLVEVTNGTACDPTVFTATVFRDDPNSAYNTTITCQFKEFFTSNFLLALQFFHLFGLFWLTNFVLALGECTLAGGFASWYWAFKKPKDVPRFALIQSFGRALLFHAGSLAFGSLLVAIVQILRVLLAYVQKKLKGKTGKVTQALLCVLGVCLWCFEKIIKYINRQAYIEIAIYGYDFCTASCSVVKLILRNIVTTAVKDRVVGFLLLFGKIAITAVIGVLAYLGFADYLGAGEILWGQPLNYYLVPVVVLTVTAFLIASGFMSVYHMAVDTIFICALEDLERNDGKDKPYFMSKQLMKLLDVKNQDKKKQKDLVQMESLETVQS